MYKCPPILPPLENLRMYKHNVVEFVLGTSAHISFVAQSFYFNAGLKPVFKILALRPFIWVYPTYI